MVLLQTLTLASGRGGRPHRLCSALFITVLEAHSQGLCSQPVSWGLSTPGPRLTSTHEGAPLTRCSPDSAVCYHALIKRKTTSGVFRLAFSSSSK